jgi:hypothetical protein
MHTINLNIVFIYFFIKTHSLEIKIFFQLQLKWNTGCTSLTVEDESKVTWYDPKQDVIRCLCIAKGKHINKDKINL